MAKRKEAIEKFSDYANTSRRYFLSVMGEYLEKEIGINNDWRTKDGWENIVMNDFEGECIYCGDKDVFFEREHLDNIADGGLDIRGNIAPACVPCNRSKKNRTWLKFIEDKSISKEEANIRIERVNKHRVNSNWDNVINHPIYPNLGEMIGFIPDDLNDRIKSWALNWIFTSIGGPEYIYHVVSEKDWSAASSKKTYPVSDEKNIIIPCVYESQLEKFTTNKIWPGSRIVIISFKKSDLQKQGINIQDVSSCSLKTDVPQIHGLITLNLVHHATNPFTYNDANDLYNELRNIKNSITSQGKKLW